MSVLRPQFKVAIDALAALFVAVSYSANVNTTLQAYQDVNEISSVALYIYSETRWEGRVQLLECALKLRKSLPCLKLFAASQKIGTDCPEFLEELFFVRLAMYQQASQCSAGSVAHVSDAPLSGRSLVLLAYHETAKSFAPSLDLAAEAPVETTFREAIHAVIKEYLVAPLSCRANAFAKAAIFHPDICRLLQHELLSKAVFEACAAVVKKDIDALSGEGTITTQMTHLIFDRYLESCKNRPAAVFLGIDKLKQNGLYGSTDALTYWRDIGRDIGNPFSSLIPIASMMLALPAGEAHNEFVFSCSGRILSRDRAAMSAVRLEQVTVLVMFIRNFGWSQHQLMEWVKRGMAEVQRNGRAQ